MTTDNIIQIVAIAIDAIVAGLTIGTLWVAIQANKQNKEEITQAMKAIDVSLKAQEQTKNLELFKDRMDKLHIIEQTTLPFLPLTLPLKQQSGHGEIISTSELVILFHNDKTIISLYNKMREDITKTNELIGELKYYFDKVNENNNDGESGTNDNTILQEIIRYESLCGRYDCNDETIEQFEKYCNVNVHIDIINETGEKKEYNYLKIQRDIENIRSSFYDAKEKLINCLKVFIEESIKRIE